MAHHGSIPTSQPSLFSQVSGVPAQSQSALSNLSGEGSHAGIKSSVEMSAQPSARASLAESGSVAFDSLAPACWNGISTEQLPDICRNRHGGNPQSGAANERVHPTKNSVREEIYRLIAASAGLTSKEIAKLLNKEIHTFSGRLTKLKADNRIEETGAERDGCAVLRTKGTNA